MVPDTATEMISGKMKNIAQLAPGLVFLQLHLKKTME